MAASSPNPMDRAKSGYPDAIAQLLNRSLSPKQIVAKVTLKRRLLQIVLVSVQTPNQQAMLELIQKGMLALSPTNIDEVEVFGQQSNQATYSWSTRFTLTATVQQKTSPKVVLLNAHPKRRARKIELFNLIVKNQDSPPFSKSSKPKQKNLCLLLLSALMGVGLASGTGFLLFARQSQAQLIEQTLVAVDPNQLDDNQSNLAQSVANREKIKTAIIALESVPNFPGSLSSQAQEEASQLKGRLTRLDQAISNWVNQNWQEAQILSQEANKQITAPRASATALRSARTRLERAIALVELIPQEDAVFAPSRTALSNYQSQLKTLSDRLAIEDTALREYSMAIELATEASTLTQGRVHPADIWTQAVSKWQEAISHLKSVSAQTSISTNAQKRLSSYGKNLSTIQARLSAEQKAVTDFNTATGLAIEAAKSTQNAPHPSTTWQTAAQRWQQAISLLKGIPAGTTVSQQARGKVSSYQSNLKVINANLQKQLVAEALERLRPQIESVVNQFSALDSSLDVGMNYITYSQEVRSLKISLDQLAREPGAAGLPVYKSLETAFSRYDLALGVWRYYAESDESHRFFPASSPYGSLLVSSYGVSTTDIVGNRYIYLNDALSAVWSRASNAVKTAQGQI
ncbi:hypothetical protein IFO70_29970 [Phormidium tenue FACHB-886]|nr:hypothetical protein [Phormidium tenue FACHB-886]